MDDDQAAEGQHQQPHEGASSKEERETSGDKSEHCASEKPTGPIPGQKLDPNQLEEDDEFEEFNAQEWQGRVGDDDEEPNMWENNWDEETLDDDFSKQLRTELEKHGFNPQN